MRTLFLAIFVLVSVFSQTSTTNATDSTPVTAASQEDVKSLESKINKMKSEMVQAVDQAANRSEKEKKEIARRYEKSIEDLKLELQKSQQEAKKEAQERKAAYANQERRFWIIAGGAMLFVCGLLGWLLFGNRHQKQTASVTIKSRKGLVDTHESLFCDSRVLVDPNKLTMKEALFKNPKQIFILPLEGSRKAVCVAVNGEDGNPVLISINDESLLSSPVAWENRKKAADKRTPHNVQ